MAFASLLILMGLGSDEEWALVSDVVIEVGVFLAAAYLAYRPGAAGRGRRGPRRRSAVSRFFYLVAGAVAAVAGSEYLGAVGAGGAASRRPRCCSCSPPCAPRSTHEDGDVTAHDADDCFPGIGIDAETPVGSTRDHSDAHEGAPVEPPRRAR